jgi:DNA-binding MarR family transcriptional regulator
MRSTVIIDAKRLREILRPKSILELWPGAYETLEVVASAPGITIGQLDKYFGCKRNAKARVLSRLIEEGYLIMKMIKVPGRHGTIGRTRAYWVRKGRR